MLVDLHVVPGCFHVEGIWEKTDGLRSLRYLPTGLWQKKSVDPLLYYTNSHSSQCDRDCMLGLSLSSLLALDHGVSSTENCPSSLLSETLTLIYCSMELTKTLLQILVWFLQKILWDDEAEISIILWRGNRCRVQSSIKDVGTRLT